MMTLHGLDDAEAWRVRIALSGCLTIGGRRFWSLDSERFGGRWVWASGIPNDDQVVAFWLAHDGPRYRAELLSDVGFFDHAAALATLEGIRARDPALFSPRTATGAVSPRGKRQLLRRHLHTALSLIFRATAQAIDWTLLPGMRGPSARAMMRIAASHGASDDLEPSRVIAPVRRRSGREEDRPECSGCPWRTGAVPLPQSLHNSGEADQGLPVREDHSSAGLPPAPSEQNHPSTFAPPSGDDGEPKPPTDGAHRLSGGAE